MNVIQQPFGPATKRIVIETDEHGRILLNAKVLPVHVIKNGLAQLPTPVIQPLELIAIFLKIALDMMQQLMSGKKGLQSEEQQQAPNQESHN